MAEPYLWDGLARLRSSVDARLTTYVSGSGCKRRALMRGGADVNAARGGIAYTLIIGDAQGVFNVLDIANG